MKMKATLAKMEEFNCITDTTDKCKDGVQSECNFETGLCECINGFYGEFCEFKEMTCEDEGHTC